MSTDVATFKLADSDSDAMISATVAYARTIVPGSVQFEIWSSSNPVPFMGDAKTRALVLTTHKSIRWDQISCINAFVAGFRAAKAAS